MYVGLNSSPHESRGDILERTWLRKTNGSGRNRPYREHMSVAAEKVVRFQALHKACQLRPLENRALKPRIA